MSIRKSAVALPLLALSSLDALTQADPARPEPLMTPLMTQELSDATNSNEVLI